MNAAENGEGRVSSPFVLVASRLIACGVNVIPIQRGDKRPAIRWERFQRQRLLDWDIDKVDNFLASWWERPDPFNIGVVTGDVSGIAVVDVDSLAARQLFIRTVGCWPRTVDTDAAHHPAATPTATTPHAGWHIWYRYSAGMRNGVRRGGEKLDVRGDGGYVVVPPSNLGRYGYGWGVSPFASEGGIWPPMEMPDTLHELLFPTRKVLPNGSAPTIVTTKYVDAALEREVAAVASASEGVRNDQLNRSAYALARFVRGGRLKASDYVSALTSAALRTGLGDSEIRATLASALNGRT